MSISIELEKLFLEWRNAQVEVNGNDELLNNTTYLFTPDGLVGSDAVLLSR
ncbi:MAG: hypothetical protein FWF47_05635 [Clostridia bacterium]|nr:hypothetical protein [Clostridia bacterium]